MAFQRVGSLKGLPAGSMMEIESADRKIAVCNMDGELHAVDGVCPHRGGPLAHGALHGRMVVCPWHAWEFDCVSGEHDYDPRIKLETFSVTIQGDDILIDLPV